MILPGTSSAAYSIHTKANTNLIGAHHVLVKDLTGDLVDQRVCNPSAIMTVGDFSELVFADLIHSDLICFFITFDRNLGRHPPNGGDLASESRREHVFGIFDFQDLLMTSLN